jgi:hypothetical protein
MQLMDHITSFYRVIIVNFPSEMMKDVYINLMEGDCF